MKRIPIIEYRLARNLMEMFDLMAPMRNKNPWIMKRAPKR
jgi:hypothetical protein